MDPSETRTCNQWGSKTLRIRGDASDRHIFQRFLTYYFNKRTVHLLLFCTMTNKCTIISQIITLLHVLTLLCILVELVINTMPSYTSISNAAVGNTIYN
jgi:hypothetical protein